VNRRMSRRKWRWRLKKWSAVVLCQLCPKTGDLGFEPRPHSSDWHWCETDLALKLLLTV